MARSRSRRSARVAISIPIRIFAVDYKGRDFTEDAVTVVVNRHGAKIRLTHQLLPDQEIRVVCQTTKQDSVFRVVSKAGDSDREFSYWGVENLEPRRNLWGVEVPPREPEDQACAQVKLKCPHCAASQSVRVSESLLAALEQKGGLARDCSACNQSGMWKPLPFGQA